MRGVSLASSEGDCRVSSPIFPSSENGFSAEVVNRLFQLMVERDSYDGDDYFGKHKGSDVKVRLIIEDSS